MSKPKKQKPAESSLYGKLEINGLNREARAQVLLAAYLEYPAEISHQRRLRDLALRTTHTYNALLQVATRRGWKEALEASQGTPNTTEAAEVGVLAVTAVEEVNRTFSALQMAAGIRAYAQVANEVCMSFSRTTQKLVSIWVQRIDRVIGELADPANPSEYEVRELARLHEQLAGFLESAARYISPQAQVQLLTAVNFSASLPPPIPEDVDASAFTVARLQQVLSDMGLKPILGDAQAATDTWAKYDDLPDIEGRR